METDTQCTVDSVISSLCMDESSTAKPPLPPKRTTKRVFDVYREQIERVPTSDIPTEMIVSDPDHDLILRNVLLNHPSARNKVGAGVEYIFFRRFQRDDKYFTSSFVKRKDGTDTIFSVMKPYRIAALKRKSADDML